MARRLLYLNGLAIIGAVLNHTIGWGYVAMFFWTHRYLPVVSPNFDQIGSPSYFGLRLFEQLLTPSIPAFLFVSGFFVAFATRKSQPTVEWKFVGTRIRFLVIPYLLWSLLMLGAQAVQGEIFSPLEYLRKILLGETTAAFYFVPLVVQLYLLAPTLVPLARARARLLLGVAAILMIAAHGIRYFQILNIPLPVDAALQVFAAGWFFPGNLFWFALGMVFGIHQAAFRELVSRMRWWILGGAILLLAAGMVEWETLLQSSGQRWITPKETLVDTIYSLAFLLAFIAFEPAKSAVVHSLEELGSRSYGIYLVHTLVLTFLTKGVYHLMPWMLGMQILYQPLLLVSGLGIPILLMELVKRSPVRKMYAYQFG